MRLGLRGDVLVTAVADEELGSIGTEALVSSVTADAAIVAEPTDERVAVAHKGFVGFEVEAHGRAAHGSRPDLGIDAIAAMGPVLTRITELDRAPASGGGPPAPGYGIGACLAHRRRPGVLELSRPLPPDGRAAHDSR